MNHADIIRRLHTALPRVRQWLEARLEESAQQARPVSQTGFQRLAQSFPESVLARAKVVSVHKIPFPPLAQMGLPELSGLEQLPRAGMTFKDTFFVQSSHQTEALFAHELVHVIQWDRLGVDRFLLAYGVGLVRYGYEDSPLEQMAYALQKDFERGRMPPDVVTFVGQKTDEVWKQVAPALGMQSV